MFEVINHELISLLIGGFPVLSASVAGWLLAERRANQYLEMYRLAEARTRAVLRDAAGIESELARNGDVD